jgi:hypothetical protein
MRRFYLVCKERLFLDGHSPLDCANDAFRVSFFVFAFNDLNSH